MSYGLYNNEFAQINHQYTWMNVAAAPAYPTLGLLCHLPLDSSLNDDSGNGNHAIAKDATELAQLSYTTGKIANGLVVPNRSGTGFRLSNLSTNGFTISIWYKTNKTADGVLFNTNSATAVPAGWFVSKVKSTGKVYLEVYNGSWSNTGDSSSTYNDNNWHLHMLSFDGTNAWRYYIDNPTTAVLSLTKSAETNGDIFYVGTYQPFNGQACWGMMDSLFYYNRALSEAERLQLWNGGAGV